MTGDSLPQLLRDADTGRPPSRRSPAGLALLLQSRLSRQRRGRRAALIICPTVLVGLLLLQRTHRPIDLPPTMTDPSLSAIRSEIAKAQLAAQVHILTAQRLESLQRASRAEFVLALDIQAPDPLALVQSVRDRAALALIYDADRLDQTQRQRQADAYQRVLELFPQSAAANLARKRLREASSCRSRFP
jgi:hypothetical protein